MRAEQKATGVSANELAHRVRGTMSRPLVLKALREPEDPGPGPSTPSTSSFTSPGSR